MSQSYKFECEIQQIENLQKHFFSTSYNLLIFVYSIDDLS